MTQPEQLTIGKILATSAAYSQMCSLHAAVKLDLFTLLGDAQLTASDMAPQLQGAERGIAMLLDALTAMGLLIKTGDKYANTKESKAYLIKTSPQYQGYIMRHHAHLIGLWSHLDKAVIRGRRAATRSKPKNQAELEGFLLGMFNLAMGIAPTLAEQIDLSGRTQLLDLGGGPGTYAIQFCLRNPQLKATVFDLPTTEPFAAQTIKKFALASRVKFQRGDYLKQTIAGTYDVAWLSHILHSLGPRDCAKVLRKAVAALKPGALLFIHEFILDDTRTAPLFSSLFSLNMLVNTTQGQSYSETELRAMLETAGIREVKRLDFTGPNQSGIVYGVVREA